jgi:hypothetical protein
MDAQGNVSVVLVAGSEPERFRIVAKNGLAVTRMGFESAIRTELRRRGLSDAEIDLLIEQGRSNPS